MGFFDGLGSALLGGVASLIGGERRNDAQAAQAEQANAFSAQQFATRYQTTVKDMEAAGLNPMLAYSQGGGSPPGGQQAQMADTVTPAVQSFNQAKLASAQVANIEADTSNKQASADLIAAQAAASWASAGQARSNTNLIDVNVDKARQEIANLKTDNDRAKALIDVAREQYQNLIKEGYNLTEVGNQIRATISKIGAQVPLIREQTFKTAMEGRLSQLDVEAAESWGNSGRITKEVMPFINLLRSIIRR